MNFEKKMIITGRDTGVTGEEYTNYILAWVNEPTLDNKWSAEVNNEVKNNRLYLQK